MPLIKSKNNVPKGVTKKGIELGIQPEVTETIQKALDETTSPIIQPLHETEKDTVIEDVGSYKGIIYQILRSRENHFKGYAVTLMQNRVISFETDIYKAPKYAWIELKSKMDAFIKVSERLKNKWKSKDFENMIMNWYAFENKKAT